MPNNLTSTLGSRSRQPHLGNAHRVQFTPSSTECSAMDKQRCRDRWGIRPLPKKAIPAPSSEPKSFQRLLSYSKLCSATRNSVHAKPQNLCYGGRYYASLDTSMELPCALGGSGEGNGEDGADNVGRRNRESARVHAHSLSHTGRCDSGSTTDHAGTSAGAGARTRAGAAGARARAGARASVRTRASARRTSTGGASTSASARASAGAASTRAASTRAASARTGSGATGARSGARASARASDGGRAAERRARAGHDLLRAVDGTRPRLAGAELPDGAAAARRAAEPGLAVRAGFCQ
jgi:hypothetical protein